MVGDAPATQSIAARGGEDAAQYRRGALFVAGAALAWSSAGLIARTTATDNWTTLFWRSLFATLFLLVYIALRYGRAAPKAFARPGLPPAPSDLVLLALFGVGQMGLGLILFTAGVRLIPAADAGLITVLEVVLAPVWVWLAFGENPGPRALTGGAIVLAAVIGHTL